MFERGVFETPKEHIGLKRPEAPVMYFAPRVLREQADRFCRGFRGQVTFAVKANPAPEVLENLVAAGLSGFDVASPEEIAQVRAASAAADLHYNNPVRSRAEIAAGKAAYVRSWSVDDLAELVKLGTPQHAAEEVAVRFKLPVKGAHYDFGAKFGATPAEAVVILKAVAAAEIAQQAGVEPERLNVGGGFASHRSGMAPDLEGVFQEIDLAVRQAFELPPALVCEPGRAMVAESFSLLACVKAIRADGTVFLNDGIYGGFAEWRDISATDRVSCLSARGALKEGGERRQTVFGPTCDSLDCLPQPVSLPEGLEEGDYLLFAGMGAYSLAIATRFNGYGVRDVITVKRL
ncbi:type III PLP-dependent enzyme [Lentibacter sp.]|uniref:type III PLP-dependent enzyme n=1 Tax=Lentibacter sp. TaxID=2024994 RepID=UPI003F69F064